MNFIPQINFATLGDAPSGSFATFLGGIVLAMTMVGLGFLNYGGDYSRYLPRHTPGRGVIFWTTVGIALPVSVLLILGVMLSAGNPELLARASREPLAALTGILPFWFFVPFSIVIVTSLMSAGMTGVYSSGLALMAMGVPMSRAATTIMNAVIIALGAFYLTFISDSFLSTFTSFLAAISVIMGSWGAIEIVDLLRQKRLSWNVNLALPPSQGGKNLRWSACLSLLVATLVGLGTITSSDPYIGKITSFLLSEETKASVFAQANIGVVAAMTLPALTANSRKQEVVSRLQKFNSTMQQAVLLSVVDNGPVEYWNKESMATSDESDASDGYDFVEGSKQAEKFFKEYLGPYIKYLSLEMTDEFVYPLKLVFSDGTCAYLKNGGYIDFVFDINCNKKPNKYGYDRFYYSLSIKKNNAGKYFAPFYKTITTENWNDRNWLLENCDTNSGDASGVCARLIEYDGWQIKEDYPHKI